jgi:hypothetical protein
MFNVSIALRFNCDNGVFIIKCLLFMRPIYMWRPRTPSGVRCAHFPSVITTLCSHMIFTRVRFRGRILLRLRSYYCKASQMLQQKRTYKLLPVYSNLFMLNIRSGAPLKFIYFSPSFTVAASSDKKCYSLLKKNPTVTGHF